MINIIVHIVFIGIFLLVSFFGIGPVLMADGVVGERIVILIIVILIYILWFFLYRYFIKRAKNDE